MSRLPLYRYKVIEITKIYDGDTIRCNVDLGFGVILSGLDGNGQSFRLADINAPEIRGKDREEGIKSRDVLRELMDQAEEVQVQSLVSENDKYGRYIGIFHILVGGDWINVNAWLVENGYAKILKY